MCTRCAAFARPFSPPQKLRLGPQRTGMPCGLLEQDARNALVSSHRHA